MGTECALRGYDGGTSFLEESHSDSESCKIVFASLPLTDDDKVAKSRSRMKKQTHLTLLPAEESICKNSSNPSIPSQIDSKSIKHNDCNHNNKKDPHSSNKKERKTRKLPSLPSRPDTKPGGAKNSEERKDSISSEVGLQVPPLDLSDLTAHKGDRIKCNVKLQIISTSDTSLPPHPTSVKEQACQTEIRGVELRPERQSLKRLPVNSGREVPWHFPDPGMVESPRYSPRRMTSSELHRTPDQMVKQADRLIERTQCMLARSAEAKRRTEELLKLSRERRAEERREELSETHIRTSNSNGAEKYVKQSES